MLILNDLKMTEDLIQKEDMVLAYFTSRDCNMCKDLYPKIDQMLEKFPKIKAIRNEVDQCLELVGKYNILSVPVIVLFIQGKETIRKVRQISVGELEENIERYYNLLF